MDKRRHQQERESTMDTRLAGWCGHVMYPPDSLMYKEDKWDRHRLSKQQIL